MPLHDLGYRNWPGQRSWRYFRWLVIAIIGIQLVWRGTWLRRTFFVAWLPAAAMAFGFFAYEQSIIHPEQRRMFARFLSRTAALPQIAQALRDDPAEARHEVWSALLLTFFRYPQAILMVLVVGIIAPRLISFDLRSRGLLLYFSKPISPAEYILGKSMVIWFYLALITTLPALFLYLLGVLFSPHVDVIWQTWDLPLRVLGASIVLIVPTAAIAVAYSSMTTESRYASVGWFATWIVGWVAYGVLTISTINGEQMGPRFARRGLDRGIEPDLARLQERWQFVSPYHVLGKVQQWVFGLTDNSTSILPYVGAIGLVTIVATIVVYFRIRSKSCS